MHIALAGLIFIALILFAITFIGAWILLALGRFLARAFGGGPSAGRAGNGASGVIYCGHKDCQAGNPIRARFCRRCGNPLQRGGQFASRRVA